MILVDTSVLSHLIFPEANPPIDPASGKPVARCQERREYFVRTHSKARILLPAPSLAELLVMAGGGLEDVLERINKTSAITVKPFDQAAAIECALMERDARKSTLGKKGGSDAPWQKVKIDRQILAIGRVHGATAFYSDDRDLQKLAASIGVHVHGVADLELPPDGAQNDFVF